MVIEYHNLYRLKEFETIYQLVYSLTEIQRLAYLPAQQKSPKDILRMHLKALVFGCLHCQIFKKFKSSSVFGAPFHCLVAHFPDTFRLVSLSSIVAEASEREFNQLR